MEAFATSDRDGDEALDLVDGLTGFITNEHVNRIAGIVDYGRCVDSFAWILEGVVHPALVSGSDKGRLPRCAVGVEIVTTGLAHGAAVTHEARGIRDDGIRIKPERRSGGTAVIGHAADIG